MSPQDWRDLASVYRAGEKTTWGWMGNHAAPVLGSALGAMADRCEEIALEKNSARMREEDL
jgi:hypothetical protein